VGWAAAAAAYGRLAAVKPAVDPDNLLRHTANVRAQDAVG
jgi:Berberine and berberine like